MCAQHLEQEQQSDKQGNLYIKWCFTVINSRLHDSHALAGVFLAMKARGLFVSFVPFMNTGLNVHRKINLRLEMKQICLDPE